MTKPFTVEQLRCLELARIIREGASGIDLVMSDYRNYCGTAACIAGLACAVYDKSAWQANDGNEMHVSACNLLGLAVEPANRLFAPWVFTGPEPDDITPEMAAATLERFAMTGEVVWK